MGAGNTAGPLLPGRVVMQRIELLTSTKTHIESLELEALGSYIVTAMSTVPLLSEEAASFLLEIYRNRLAELYY